MVRILLAVYLRLALELFKALADIIHGEKRMEWGQELQSKIFGRIDVITRLY